MNTSVAAVIVAMAGLAAFAAGCGGSRSASGTSTSSAHQSRAVAFSACMRSNGVTAFPDPTGETVPKVGLQQLGVSAHRFQAAEGACRHLLPNGGRGPSPARVQYVRALSLSFARCVRTHGVPSFPDPDSTGRIPDPATVGIDQGSPKFEAANAACARYRPPYMPSNAAYNVYTRAHGG